MPCRKLLSTHNHQIQMERTGDPQLRILAKIISSQNRPTVIQSQRVPFHFKCHRQTDWNLQFLSLRQFNRVLFLRLDWKWREETPCGPPPRELIHCQSALWWSISGRVGKLSLLMGWFAIMCHLALCLDLNNWHWLSLSMSLTEECSQWKRQKRGFHQTPYR